MTRYLLAGGGTAGHVNPLLAIADRLRESEPECEIVVLGTREGLEAKLVPARGYVLETIPRLPMPRRPGRALVQFPARFRSIVVEIAELVKTRQIDVVVGVGGYVSAPAYLAARRAKVPIVLHEANAMPGWANRLGSWLTSHVGVAFAGTRLRHARVVGMPLRAEIEALDRRAERSGALEFFGLAADRPVLLVTGGSLGAQKINDTIIAGSTSILGAGWQILHITGDRDVAGGELFDDHHLISYCDRMDLALACADLVVARSGAATVSELTVLGIPAVFVPLAVGNGEQARNARGSVEAGGSVLVSNDSFSPVWIDQHLIPLILNPQRLAEMSSRALSIAVPGGTSSMVELIHEAVEIH